MLSASISLSSPEPSKQTLVEASYPPELLKTSLLRHLTCPVPSWFYQTMKKTIHSPNACVLYELTNGDESPHGGAQGRRLFVLLFCTLCTAALLLCLRPVLSLALVCAFCLCGHVTA